MQMIVRFEVDACLPFEPGTNAVGSSGGPSGTSDIDGLAAAFAAATLSPPPTSSSSQSSAPRSQQPAAVHHPAAQKFAPKAPAAALAVRHGGTVLPQTHVIELKTRAAHALPQVAWAELVPQLYLSQTPHFFLALHAAGAVSEVRALGADELALREAAVQPALRRLRAALEAIQERAVEHGPGALLSLVCRDGVLRLYEREDGRGAVPVEVMKRFEC